MWSTTADYWGTLEATTREVKKQLDAAGIDIPFPQRDLHLRSVDEDVARQLGAGEGRS